MPPVLLFTSESPRVTQTNVNGKTRKYANVMGSLHAVYQMRCLKEPCALQLGSGRYAFSAPPHALSWTMAMDTALAWRLL